MSETPPPPPDLPAPEAPAVPPALAENPSPSALRGALREGRAAEVIAVLQRVPPVRRAELFLLLRPQEQKQVLSAAPPELAAAILADCDSASLAHALVPFELPPLAPILRLIPPDNLADLLIHLSPGLREQLQGLLDPELRAEVERLSAFDPESAGGLMTTRYLSIPDVVTVGRALELLRSGKADTPSYVYVVDVYGKLAGVAPLRGLLLAHARKTVSSIMVRDVVRIRTSASRDEIAAHFEQYHYVSLPVVDEKDRLVGIVTLDDVRTAQRRGEEQVVAAVTGADPREALKETLSAARGRLPWVTFTILGGLSCAALSALFKRTLEEAVVLGMFLPIVLALGESIGAQTTAVFLASLAGGRVTRAELATFARKEIVVGLLMGLYSGAAVSGASFLWHGDPRLGLVIGGAILVSVVWAALLAVAIPALMRRLRINPSVASGPLVLGVADLSTLAAYLGGAAFLLR